MIKENTQSLTQKAAASPAAAFSIQRNLSIGSVNDPLEHEADDMADKVMRMPQPDFAQRKCDSCQDEEEQVQRKQLSPFIQRRETNQAQVAPDVHEKITGSRGSGAAMDVSTRSFMESRFGNDFGDVRIHSGSDAVHLSRNLNAQAFTVGKDVYFGEGKYNPQSDGGKHLLAHELTHTIQQGNATSLQRSCSDAKCDACTGGKKDFWMTVYFRRKADAATLKAVNKEMAEAKTVLEKCCLDLKFDLKKDKAEQVAGSATMDAYKPATAKDRWRYTADETALGTGTTFDGAKGIPMLVVDDVPLSGGGVTVDKKFDPNYKGKNYVILGLNQSTTVNSTCNSTAHELWHVGGTDKHDPANGAITSCSGNGVSDKYCNNLRALV